MTLVHVYILIATLWWALSFLADKPSKPIMLALGVGHILFAVLVALKETR